MMFLVSIAPANARDLSYIVSLSRRHADALGFLTRGAMQAYLDRGRVTIARENGDPCGYFLTGGLNESVRIFQACVQLDARNLKHGWALGSELITRAAAAGSKEITLHCRDGLDSNAFWAACGFSLTSCICGGSARRKIVNIWTLQIADALTNPALPYSANFLASIRARTFEGIGQEACRRIA